jgi:hypothetical protein
MIRDMDSDGGYLAVDLRHVLEALGERAQNSWWRMDLEWATDDTPEKQLETLAEQGQMVDGRTLKAAAERVVQVIDGEFAAFDPGSEEPWVTVEAVDSSYYTVRSADTSVLQAILARFRDVTEYDHPDS